MVWLLLLAAAVGVARLLPALSKRRRWIGVIPGEVLPVDWTPEPFTVARKRAILETACKKACFRFRGEVTLSEIASSEGLSRHELASFTQWAEFRTVTWRERDRKRREFRCILTDRKTLRFADVLGEQRAGVFA